MFAHAVQTAARFTHPYLGLRRSAQGVSAVVAGFVVLNDAGWIVTSAHLIDEIAAREADVLAAVEAATDPAAVAHTELWAVPGFVETRPRVTQAFLNRAADIAVARLEPCSPMAHDVLPRLRDTVAEPIEQGESVCRLGFPFHGIAAGFDEALGQFDVPADNFPVPRFALDGIVSRFNRRTAPDGTSAVFIETSTPGLRGQSGGPLLDRQGRICGIQSHTSHLDLGFDAAYTASDGSQVVERQFLNVGAASHVDEVRALLDVHGIGYALG